VTDPTPLERLAERIRVTGAPLCMGIDPHPDALPDELPPDVSGVERFARGLLEAGAEAAVAVKVNIGFFEAFGSAGWAALERLRREIPATHLFILDAKRGDIGSTAERYASAIFGHLKADAVTLSAYLGADAIAPFLAYPDRVVYLLARTSNEDAGTFQDLPLADGTHLDARIAAWTAHRWPGDPRVGLVVGATRPGDLERIRKAAPDPAFLVPGVGAQGGDLSAAVAACDGRLAPGVVNISRGIAGASRGPDWRAAAAEASRRWQGLMREAGGTLRP
jgi:orotidine 5'-phosphate decarboxylase subfamily 2